MSSFRNRPLRYFYSVQEQLEKYYLEGLYFCNNRKAMTSTETMRNFFKIALFKSRKQLNDVYCAVKRRIRKDEYVCGYIIDHHFFTPEMWELFPKKIKTRPDFIKKVVEKFPEMIQTILPTILAENANFVELVCFLFKIDASLCASINFDECPKTKVVQLLSRIPNLLEYMPEKVKEDIIIVYNAVALQPYVAKFISTNILSEEFKRKMNTAELYCSGILEKYEYILEWHKKYF